jgi:hypothetical protein
MPRSLRSPPPCAISPSPPALREGGDPRELGVLGYPPPQPSAARGEGAHLRCRNSAIQFRPHYEYYFAGCGAGDVPKSTFGAVEISFSFSTEKFGFSL